MTITQVLLTAVIALVTSLCTYVVAPQVHWDIEQKREQRNYRIKLIQECKNLLEKDIDIDVFSKSSIYSSLKPYFSKEVYELVESWEPNKIVIVEGGRGGGINPFKTKVLDDLARLEKDWKLS